MLQRGPAWCLAHSARTQSDKSSCRKGPGEGGGQSCGCGSEAFWYLHLTLGMADVQGIQNPKQNNEATVWGPGLEASGPLPLRAGCSSHLPYLVPEPHGSHHAPRLSLGVAWAFRQLVFKVHGAQVGLRRVLFAAPWSQVHPSEA